MPQTSSLKPQIQKPASSPDKLLNLLAIPGTDTPPILKVETFSDGVPYTGWLLDATGKVVAKLDRFRFDFLHFDATAEAVRSAAVGSPKPLEPEPAMEIVPLAGERVTTRGDWFWIDGWLFGNNGDVPDAQLSFETDAKRIVLSLHAHGWSGILSIGIDDGIPIELDLFNQEAGIPRRFEISNPERCRRRISLRPTGRRNDRSQGQQLLIESISEDTGPMSLPKWSKSAVISRGGAFPETVMSLLRDVPNEGILLDIGGGRRQIDDPRYVNLEYTAHDEPDLFGDGLSLPFQNCVIDAIYSSAVLEHVRDPHRLAAEIWRVLKPGGRIIVNGAFMQPIHSEGQHFFNVTNYALEMLFADFTDRQVWWTGSFKDTVRWMLEAAGITAQADAVEMKAFLSSLDHFSGMVHPDRLMYIAGDFWLAGRKA